MQKICEVCHTTFEPDPRVKERQKVCKTLRCQRERKRRAQQRWLAQNPDYFKDDYARVKEWLKTHPGYLKSYRARRGGLHKSVNNDIQDKLSDSENKVLSTVLEMLDIQDEISSKITTAKRSLRRVLEVIYKTSEAFVITGVNGS